jgi:ribosomal protein L12E/L44/L45/RPP1/RPP2
LVGPLLAGCEEQKSQDNISQRSADQTAPPAPPALGQPSSPDALKAPEKAQPEEKKDESSAREPRPGDRG